MTNINTTFKSKFYWFVMNVSEIIFNWAREKWNIEQKHFWYRPTLLGKHFKHIIK